MWVMSLSCKYDYIRNNEKPVLKLENLSLLELSRYNGKFCINICIVCRCAKERYIYICVRCWLSISYQREITHIFILYVRPYI